MSGDESEEGAHGKRFLITSLPWRSEELAGFLEDMDVAHLATRWTPAGSWSKGNMPHVREGRDRQRPRIDDRCQVVEGLPRNFYDDDWLDALESNDPEQFAGLKIQEQVDLTLPSDITR